MPLSPDPDVYSEGPDGGNGRNDQKKKSKRSGCEGERVYYERNSITDSDTEHAWREDTGLALVGCGVYRSIKQNEKHK